MKEVQTDRGKESMDEIRQLSQQMIDEETERVKTRGDESRETANLARLTFTLATVVDLLLLGLVATLIQRNVARRERDAEALRRSEEQMRLLIEGAQDYALVLLDRQGNVASWNAGAERLFGYTSDAILCRPLATLYPPEDQETERSSTKHLALASTTGRAEELGWRVRADGSRFWADAVLTPLQGERTLLGYALMTRDVTERRRAEEALRACESRFRRLADADLIGVVTDDLAGRVWEGNNAFLRIVGYTRADLQAGAINREAITPAERRRPGRASGRAAAVERRDRAL